MNCVIDTSALICLVAKEQGWEKVKEYFENGVYMSVVNLAEYYSWCSRNNFDMKIAKEVIDNLGIYFEDLDAPEAFEIGSIFKPTKPYGLSLGDRACLVLGKNLNVKIITADKIWEKLIPDFDIEIIR